LCRYDVQRRCAFEKHSGDRERHSGIGRKPFAFPPESPFTFSPESLFAFTPESFSRSPRNPFHLPPESATASNPVLPAEMRSSNRMPWGNVSSILPAIR
jgi:hypothetical protein